MLNQITFLLISEEFFVISVAVLVNVAFLTLLERKVLGLRQVRIGPRKVGAWGALQPASDAVKLFSNSVTLLGPINKGIYFLRPMLRVVISLIFLEIISPRLGGAGLSLGILFLIMMLRLNIYPLMGAG